MGLLTGLDLGNLLVHLKADSSQYDRVMKRVEQSLRRATKRMAATSIRLAKYALVAVTAQATLSVKAFASFETQLANVSTMLDEQTMHFMPGYERALKDMAMEFGEGTKTLSAGLYDILSASIPAAKAIDFLGVSVKAAKAGLTNTAVAADAITSVIKSYGLAAEEAGRISDILFATVKRGKLTFGELAPNLGKVAAIASTAGLSFEEVSAAIATMTRAGLQADLATTSLRAIMNSFISPTKEAESAARGFGFELNSTTLQTIGLTGVLQKLKGATAEQLSAIMPNIRALAGFAAMAKQAEAQVDDLNLMLNASGLTQEAYNKMTDTLTHSFKQWWQTIKITSVEIGKRLAPAVEEALRITRQWLSKNQIAVAEAFVRSIEGMVLGTERLVSFSSMLPVYWKSFRIEVLKSALGIIKLFKVLSPLYSLYSSVRGLAGAISPTSLDNLTVGIQEEIDAQTNAMLNLYSQAESKAPAIKKFFEAIREAMRIPPDTYTILELAQKVDPWLSKIEDGILSVNEAVAEGNVALSAFEKELDTWVTNAKNIYTNLGSVVANAFESMSQTLTDFIMEGKADFHDFAKSVLADLLQMMIKFQMAKSMMSIASQISWLNLPGTSTPQAQMMPVPAAAAGGLVTRPTLTMVGEAGPELITPLNKLGGMAPPSVIINNNTGQAMEQEGAPMFDGQNWIVSVVVDKINQGGLLRDTIKGIL